MAGITVERAEDMLAEAIATRSAILGSQEYASGNRKMVRAQLSEVNKDIARLNVLVTRMSAGGGIRVTGATPL